jgi:tetratricopeptide (TPR) repeat protein
MHRMGSITSSRLKALIVFAVFTLNTGFAQKSKVQAAWRHLSDYEETLRDGKPEASYLQKAKEAIDLALANEATAKQVRTHAYKLRISYNSYQLKLNEEIKRLEPTIQDKSERTFTAYGNVPLDEYQAASDQLKVIQQTDPKYFETIQQAVVKGNATLDEDDLKLATAVQQMKLEGGNIATGKYKAKKYEEAAEYFYRTAVLNTMLMKVVDTANFTNAVIAATKTKNPAKIIEFNNRMLENGVGTPANYEALYNAMTETGDTTGARTALQKGRTLFPDNINLLTIETNNHLAKGRSQQALENLKKALEKDPNNGFLTLFVGNLYDNLANPKDRNGKEMEKPTNFEELFRNAESYYKKAVELNTNNKEYMYNSLFDIGAMYNNYGGYLSTRKAEKITDLVEFQKKNDAAANEYFKKAIPYLEQSLQLKPGDIQSMKALRLLYLKTGDQAKANEMNEKIKASGK